MGISVFRKKAEIMRQVKLFSCVFLAVTAVSTGAIAAECKNTSAYSVSNLHFPKMSIESASHKILAGTPLSARVAADAQDLSLRADAVSGRLDKVLDAMALEAGAEWYQRGCDIDIKKRPVAAPAATWAVISGETLESTLKRWAAKEGWSVIWDIEEVDSLEMMANATFKGSLQEAAEALGASLAQSGEKLVMTFHGGNKVLRVSRTKTK